MLASHDAVSTTWELDVFTSYVDPWIKTWERHSQFSKHDMKLSLANVWSREKLTRHLRTFLDDVYSDVRERKPTSYFVLDKTPRYAHYVDLINEMVDDAIFIHIIRDGRDVVSSLNETAKGWGYYWAKNNAQHNADIWRKAVVAGQVASKFGERYIEVRYEQLIMDGTTELKRIFDQIGIPVDLPVAQSIYDAHQLNSMRDNYTLGTKRRASDISSSEVPFLVPEGFIRTGIAGGWKSDLSSIQQFAVERIAGELLRELGYTSDRSWWGRNAVDRRVTEVAYTISSQSPRIVKRLARRLL
jgi:hypothetical protein